MQIFSLSNITKIYNIILTLSILIAGSSICEASRLDVDGVPSLVDLIDVNTSTATSGNILIANGTDWNSVSVSGGFSITSLGVATLNIPYSRTFLPQQMKINSTDFATLNQGGNRSKIDFDATTDEQAEWQNILYPYQGGALKTKIYYTMASATTNEVIFTAALMCVTDGDSADIDTNSFDTANSSGAVTVPGTAGYLDVITITMSNNDSCASGDHISLQVYRDANDAGDDATGDAEVRMVILCEGC